MLCDCHIHMVLDGENWRAAIARHKIGPSEFYVANRCKTTPAWVLPTFGTEAINGA